MNSGIGFAIDDSTINIVIVLLLLLLSEPMVGITEYGI